MSWIPSLLSWPSNNYVLCIANKFLSLLIPILTSFSMIIYFLLFVYMLVTFLFISLYIHVNLLIPLLPHDLLQFPSTMFLSMPMHTFTLVLFSVYYSSMLHHFFLWTFIWIHSNFIQIIFKFISCFTLLSSVFLVYIYGALPSKLHDALNHFYV